MLGLLLGFLLRALGVVDNPFWVMSGGIAVGAVLSQVGGARTRGR